MRAMDGPPGAQAPANPGKTTFLPGLVAIKAMEGFDRSLVLGGEASWRLGWDGNPRFFSPRDCRSRLRR
jgi:hypothetical protein